MLALCDKIISKNKLKPHRKLFGNYTFSGYEDVDAIPKQDWEQGLQHQNAFLSLAYLNILHQQKNQNLRFRYVLVYESKKPIGVIYFQINDFSASLFGELIAHQISELQSKRASVFKRYMEQNKHETIMRLVTCGNNFISGEHGFYLQVTSKKTRFKLVEGVIDAVSREEKLRGKISAILVKDFYEEGFGDKDCWYCRKFLHFNVEPNMVIDLPASVTSMDDYIGLFSKKYRNRAKGIFNASASLLKKRLTATEVIQYQETLYSLYFQVFKQAKFKLAYLSESYFKDVVMSLPDLFYIDAWFKDGVMVSFASGFYCQNEIEAHYVGFDYAINKEYELYQTILYSYVAEAIATHKASINLGRTASEIKTTVGAKPHELICYIKPQNTVSKLIMKPFMQFLQPSEWIPRNPFKEVDAHNTQTPQA